MNISTFLQCGCFLAAPHLNKIWLLSNPSHFEKNSEFEFSFYKSNFFLSEKYPWLRGENSFNMNIEDFKQQLSQLNSIKPNIQWNSVDQVSYKKQFNFLKNEIQTGNLIKGVPFTHQISHFSLKQENLVYLLNSLFNYENNANLYLYGFWNLEQNVGFMGASPELIFTQHENLVETHALAGTIRNLKNTICNFRTSENIDKKIIREHKLVIDGIKRTLTNFGNVKEEQTELLKLEKFSHLRSVLQVNLKKDFDFEQILSAIHPTPALGAFPKKEGFHWLHDVEEKIEKRFEYCSPFGICVDENFSLCVAVIRCLQWQNGILRITAGGGVIEESVFEDEWEEICMKIASVKSYFKL